MDLYENTGADHPTRVSKPVFRAGAWTYDTTALKGDVFPAHPEEVIRFAHKLVPVDAAAYPPVPGGAEDGGGGTASAAPPETVPPGPVADTVDIELYRVGDSHWYELPSGERVNGRAAALEALGVEDG